MKKITETTTVTLSVVLFIVYGIFWLAETRSIASGAAAASDENKMEIRELRSIAIETRNDVKWLKHRLGGGNNE